MDTPVALIIFNRPTMTKRVLQEIARAKPSKLFVVADGPRDDQPGDGERCAAARAVVERVDWECEVFKNYSDVNLGCGRRPATGISWVFDHVGEAIILEDDCVPHPTFFRFCGELLARYRDDERVMHIGGHNFQLGQPYPRSSYFFSRYNLSWGWATWRRAWRHHDPAVRLWPELRETRWLAERTNSRREAEFWKRIFDDAFARRGDVDYWDYQWTFACWAQNGLSILPATNLASNIGFGSDSTHTRSATDARANHPTVEMPFPLVHPACLVPDGAADRVVFEHGFMPFLPQEESLYTRLRRRCLAVAPAPLRRSVSTLKASLAGSRS